MEIKVAFLLGKRVVVERLGMSHESREIHYLWVTKYTRTLPFYVCRKKMLWLYSPCSPSLLSNTYCIRKVLCHAGTVSTRAVNGYPGTTAGNGTTRVMRMLPGYPLKMLHQLKGYPGTRQVLVGGYPGSKMCTRNSSSLYEYYC